MSQNFLLTENHYFKLFKPDYNILQEAGSFLGYKHTEVFKLKRSEATKGQNNPLFGKTHSAETKALMGASKLGSKLSDETKAKILASNPNRKEVEVLDLETNETTIKKVNKKSKGASQTPH